MTSDGPGPSYRVFVFAVFCITVFSLLASVARGAEVGIQALAHGEVGGVTAADPQEATGGSILSEMNFAPTSGTGTARSALSAAGLGALTANGMFADGVPTENLVLAEQKWDRTWVNLTGSAESYVFDFQINPISLRISDHAGISELDDAAMEAIYDVAISLNGVIIFQSEGKVRGGLASHVLTEVGTSLGPVFFTGPAGSDVFRYDFGSYTGSLDLGSLAPGESFDVQFKLSIDAVAPGVSIRARACPSVIR